MSTNGCNQGRTFLQKLTKQLTVQGTIPLVLTWRCQKIRLVVYRLYQLDDEKNVAIHAPLPKISHEMVEMGKTTPTFLEIAESH